MVSLISDSITAAHMIRRGEIKREKKGKGKGKEEVRRGEKEGGKPGSSQIDSKKMILVMPSRVHRCEIIFLLSELMLAICVSVYSIKSKVEKK